MYSSFISFLLLIYSKSLASEECSPPENTAGLIYETGVYSGSAKQSTLPVYSCECDGIGVRYFWNSSDIRVPSEAKSAIVLESGALSADCREICICSYNGIC